MSMRCLWTDGSERYPRRRLGAARQGRTLRRTAERPRTHSRGCLREWGGRFLGGDVEGQPRELLSMHEGGPEAREGDKQTGTYYVRQKCEFSPKETKEAVGIFRTIQHRANSVSNVGKLINLPRD
jgi:hypothetical protein